jgi:hypothetical protein
MVYLMRDMYFINECVSFILGLAGTIPVFEGVFFN